MKKNQLKKNKNNNRHFINRVLILIDITKRHQQKIINTIKKNDITPY